MILTCLMLGLTLGQPLVELPVGDGLAVGTQTMSDAALVRGLQDMRLRTPGTVVGSYGQFNLEYTAPDGAPLQGEATVKRLVLFVSHHFTDSVRAYTEIEWENAVACSTCAGAVEIEQGFVDWDVHANITLRAGLILVPMGIINQWHEPPVFHGVNRPAVDTWIIPTTWRELGIGITGSFADMWRYELYAMTSPNAVHMGPAGLRVASAMGSDVPANAFMVSGRLEVEPELGMVLGVSGVGGDMGDGVRFYSEALQRERLHLPWGGAALDARFRRLGWEARVEGAAFWMPRAQALMDAWRPDGSLYFPDPEATGAVPTFMYGAYAEVAYDVLHPLHSTNQQVLPFVRVENYDTQAALPAGYVRLLTRQAWELTIGVSYRPLWQLVFKADVQRAWHRAGKPDLRINGGMGYMF